MTTVTALFAVALPIVAAALALRAALRGRLGLVLRIGFAVPVGLGAAALLHLLGLIATGEALPFWLDATIWAGIGLAAQWWRIPAHDGPIILDRREPDRAATSPWLNLAMGIAGLFAIVGFTAQQFRDPYGGSDAIAIWNLHARVLYEDPSGWSTFLGEHGLASAFHADYPLLVPANVARVWSLSGGFDAPASPCVAAAFLVGVVCLLYGGLRATCGPTTATYCTTVLLATVYFVRVAAQQFADVPFACYVLGTMVAVALAANREGSGPGSLTLAGCLGGCAALVKNEGLLFVLVFGLVWAARSLASRRAGVSWGDLLRRTGLLAAGMTPPLVMAGWHKLFVAHASDLAPSSMAQTLANLTDASRYATILAGYGREFVALAELGGIALLVHLFVVGWSRERRYRADRWSGLAVAGLVLAGYFAVYLNSPHDLRWHVGASIRRLYVHVWPLLLFVYGLSVAEPHARQAGQSEALDEQDRSTVIRGEDVRERAA